MKEGLIERIQSSGYWRVNIRPTVPLSERLSLANCRKAVESSSVSLRGWDYPYVSHGDDAHSGSDNVGDYVDNWCDWHRHVEFWRMYRSSQFLHYKLMWEDAESKVAEENGAKVVSVGDVIYRFTEIVEFLFRLHRAGLYKEGAKLSIILGNAANRQLWINDPMRMPFLDSKRTLAPNVDIVKTFTSRELGGAAPDYSLSLILEFFDQFGWNPGPDQIRTDQRRFYNRQ